MKITKTYCDRCGKEIIPKTPLVATEYFSINVSKPKPKYLFINFQNEDLYRESSHMLCSECTKEFYEWWEKRVKP